MNIMSRSRKKNPIRGWTCAESEKNDKKLWHRRFRRLVRQRLPLGEELPHFRSVSSPWLMDKDGKWRFSRPKEEPADPRDCGGSEWLRKMLQK